ncbi:MAG: glycosyltransferase family 39 protein [Chloroflexi bacterium]|nr:glycosyltransferase family 39 protein [Chloroflexota bacterium]
MNADSAQEKSTAANARRTLLIPILLLAFFFRFHALNDVPPGMTHDEGSVGFFVKQIANNTGFTIDAPYGYANEPFTKYGASVMMWIAGQSDWALRAHQAFWGVVLVLVTYKWASAAFNHRVGLGGAALVAASFWPQMTSRFALNSNPAPTLFTGAVWLMWIALFRDRLKGRAAAWIGFAILLACALMTYEASRGAWLALPAFLLCLAVFGPRHRLWQFAAALTFGTALALPHLLNPAAWGRTDTLSGPIDSAMSGNIEPLIHNAGEALGTLFVKGDPFVVYNIPGRPVLDPITALLFVGGAVWCVWHWRRPEGLFPILWFGASFAPAMAVGAFTMMLHAITAQAVLLVMPALIVDRLAMYFRRRERREKNERTLSALRALNGEYLWRGFATLVVATAAMTFRDYFGVWANAVETRAAYFSNFKGIMDYLRGAEYTGSITVSSPFPGLPHDPLNYDLRVRRGDLDARWFDAREAMVFPPTDSSLLVLPANTQPDPVFAERLPLGDAVRHIVRETDVGPFFDTVVWNPQRALNDWLADGSLTRVEPPANFGGAVELIAFKILTPAAKPGEAASTITFWRILDLAALGPRAPINYAPEAQLFLHVLDSEGNFVAGSDRLHAPAWNWHAGDTFAQIHRAPLLTDLPPGHYSLQVGIYTLPDMTRLTGANFDSFELGAIAIIAL